MADQIVKFMGPNIKKKYPELIRQVVLRQHRQLLLSAKHKSPHPNSLSHRNWDAFVFATSPLFFLVVIWRRLCGFLKHHFHVSIWHVEESVHVEVFH